MIRIALWLFMSALLQTHLPGAPRTDAAEISGVVTDAASKLPVPRVRVELTAGMRVTYTDAKGAFTFPKLGAGSYTVSAKLGGYLSASFGARHPGGEGVSVVLADSQQRRDINIELHKGGVVSGRVTDQDGRTMAEVRVSPLLMRWRSDGSREFIALRAATTDDRGEYRLFGLMPGTYLFAATPVAVTGVSALERVVSLDGVQRLAADGYVTTYFPDTTTAPDAAAFEIAADSERSGIDFQVRAVPLAHVRGRVNQTAATTSPARNGFTGVPNNGVVQLRQIDRPWSAVVSSSSREWNAVVAADGRFAFEAIPPGQYELTYSQSDSGRADNSGLAITVAGNDVADLVLTAHQAATLSGDQTVFGSDSPMTGLLFLSPLSGSMREANRAISGKVDGFGRFTFADVPAGSYVISPGSPLGEAYVTGISINGAALRGRGVIDVGTADIAGIRVTYRTPVPVLSGTVRKGDLSPVANYTLVIFPADRKDWPYTMKGSVGVRPDSSGRYSLHLSPGDYLLAAVDDVQAYQWMDPEFLQTLIPSAIKITLAEGQKLTQDLTVK